ncbi:MAG TPA: hypothetical protein VJ045_12375 [Hyphomicrobiaceae bacterium]|nr:hypothetical protein [Hyphomicrobiaceae bacterium]
MPDPKPLLLIGLAVAASALPVTQRAAARGCRMAHPDLSIYAIELTDSDSAARQVGSGAALTEDTEDLPHARFVSSNGAQELILYAHFEAGVDEYAEAEVRVAGQEALALEPLPAEVFRTEHGIELGMSATDVIDRLGRCFKRHEKKRASEVLEYEIRGADRDPKLKRYGYPVYYAEYEFQNGGLVRFRFGFESR